MVEPPEELPSGQEFLRQLPEWARWAEETTFIIDIFSHAAQAHEHLSEVLEPGQGKEGEDNGRGKERKNPKDGAACPQCHLFETRASKWSDLHLNCCRLVKDVQKIL